MLGDDLRDKIRTRHEIAFGIVRTVTGATLGERQLTNQEKHVTAWNAEARLFLLASLMKQPALHTLVSEHYYAYDMWKALVNEMEPNDVSTELKLEKEIKNLQASDFATPIDLFSALERIWKRIVGINKSLAKTDLQKICILHLLLPSAGPGEVEHVWSPFRLRYEDNQTLLDTSLAEYKAHFKAEWMRCGNPGLYHAKLNDA
jgi:hypothetical protein